MAEPLEQKSKFAEDEERILDLWDKEQTFKKSLDNRRGSPIFSFYDGPPFANGMPHFGHSLVTSIKDSIGRYKTMRGYYVERRNGWDCHGLPVEFAIEKQFGVSGKKQILELGLEKFNSACRDSVFNYKSDWEQFFTRIGRWTDTANAYATIDTSYTESVWWVLKQIHEKGLLYKGYKSMPYCPRCETPLSNFEVNEGYKDDTIDPSLYVKFKLKNEDASLLGWTTTPWSLPGNAAIAVKPDEKYIYVSYQTDDSLEDIIVLAKKRLSVLDEQNFKIIKEVNGSDLVGKEYLPLFELDNIKIYEGRENLYKIWAADFVSIEDGTGVLHVAPSFGEDDLNLGLNHNIPVLQTVDNAGHITGDIGFKDIKGKFFKQADKPVIEHLTKKDMVFSAETLRHTYPFCYRCESPLLYYAISTWFVSVASIRDKLLENAQQINWVPEHIKNGRFGKWLEGARDWAISRNRYWGAPMPIWVNVEDECDYIVVGSIDELKELAGDDIDVDDLHRPFIDKIEIIKDGKTYKRVEEVLDCWFESGSMPIAQQHFPFENAKKFDQAFPADFIQEGLDQTRLWFYVLHVISTILFEKPAYKNVLVNGMIMAADGQKLSKRLKNYPAVNDVFAKEGADTLRLYLLSNYQAVSADYMRFNRDAMKDLNRNVLGTLHNSFRFYKMYAEIDGWKPPKLLVQPDVTNVLDL
ncbi:MAG: isoleucine--tRNA ligase, partial [Candidatus Saccharibacteria bacterium]